MFGPRNLIFLLLANLSFNLFAVTADQADVTYHTPEIIFPNGVESKEDSFRLSKVTKAGFESAQPVVLLPGSFFNFNSFTVGNKSIVPTLLKAGYSVYGLSPRTQKIKLFGQSRFVKAAKGWGFEAYMQDARIVASRAYEETGKHPIILGYSLGAMTAYMLVNENPEAYAGLVIFEGMLNHPSEGVKKPLGLWCDKFQGAFDNGNTLEHVDGTKLSIAGATIDIPGMNQMGMRELIGNYPGHMENFKMLAGTYKHWNPWGKLSYAVPTVSSHALIAEAFDRANKVEPMKVKADFACIMSGKKEVDTSNLKNFDRPVLAIGAELGMGERIKHNLQNFPQENVTIDIVKGIGHGDILTAFKPDPVVNNTLVKWLEANFKN